MAKIRYLDIVENSSEGYTIKSLTKTLKDFGLFVKWQESGASGRDAFCSLVVSDEEVIDSLLQEVLDEPPDAFDYSDVKEHDIKKL